MEELATAVKVDSNKQRGTMQNREEAVMATKFSGEMARHSFKDELTVVLRFDNRKEHDNAEHLLREALKRGRLHFPSHLEHPAPPLTLVLKG